MACLYCNQKYFMLECKNNRNAYNDNDKETHLEWYCGLCFPFHQICNRCYKNEPKCWKCKSDKIVKCNECNIYNYCNECFKMCIYCEKFETS